MPTPIQKPDLSTLGLTKQEAELYLAVLTHGESPMRTLWRKTSLNRSTAYTHAEALVEKGLLSTVTKHGIFYYKARSAQKLIEQKQHSLAQLETTLEQLRMTLPASTEDATTSTVRGKEAMRQLLHDILANEKEVLILGDGDAFLASMPDWAESYMAKREQKGIKAKILVKHSVRKTSFAHNRLGGLTHIRMLPPGFHFSGGYDVLEKKAIFYSFGKDSYAVIIEHPVIVSLLRAIHQMLWTQTL